MGVRLYKCLLLKIKKLDNFNQFRKEVKLMFLNNLFYTLEEFLQAKLVQIHYWQLSIFIYKLFCIVKGLPQQAEVAQGVPGRLRPRIFLTFSTLRVVGRQPKAPAAFTPGEIPGTHFQRLSQPQGTWFCQQLRKKSPVTPPGIDPKTIQLVAQCLNHYATPGPFCIVHNLF